MIRDTHIQSAEREVARRYGAGLLLESVWIRDHAEFLYAHSENFRLELRNRLSAEIQWYAEQAAAREEEAA